MNKIRLMTFVCLDKVAGMREGDDCVSKVLTEDDNKRPSVTEQLSQH